MFRAFYRNIVSLYFVSLLCVCALLIELVTRTLDAFILSLRMGYNIPQSLMLTVVKVQAITIHWSNSLRSELKII